MAIKDIIVHIDSSEGCPGRLQAAISLAQFHDAHLTGLYNIPPPYLPSFAAAEIPFDIRQTERASTVAIAEKAGDNFKQKTDREGLRAEWRVTEGDYVNNLCISARYSDLLILGQSDDRDNSASDLSPDNVVLACGRPVMIIPYIGVQQTLGKHIMVAWNGTREAVRAINDAMPLLKKAEKVDVVTVNIKSDGYSDNQVPGVDITHQLARHGINATSSSLEGVKLNIGDTLLSHVADIGADLIVMGAYGHSRLREMVMGGATKSFLNHMTVPVVMSH